MIIPLMGAGPSGCGGNVFPGTITGFGATGGYQSVSLDWDDTADATRYEVQRSANGSTGWTTLDDTLEVSEYDDTGLADGATWYYRVRAGNASAWGPWSDVDSATTYRSPSQVTTLVLELYSDVGTYQDTGGVTPANADGDPVGLWEDQSGNGNDASQGTADNRPTLRTGELNGLPVVRFDGSSDHLLHGIDIAGACTVFAVLDLGVTGGGTSYRGVYSHGNGSAGCMVLANTGSNKWGSYGSADLNADTQLDTNPHPHLLVLKKGASGVTFYLDGAADGNNAGTPVGQAAKHVGGEPSGVPQFVNGDLAALLVCDSALSDADREEIETWLAAKYGLTLS